MLMYKKRLYFGTEWCYCFQLFTRSGSFSSPWEGGNERAPGPGVKSALGTGVTPVSQSATGAPGAARGKLVR